MIGILNRFTFSNILLLENFQGLMVKKEVLRKFPTQWGYPPPTVPQEGHNFVFPENGFFHLSSLFEGKILIFRGEMGLGTIFFRMYSDFKKKGLKK